MGIMEQMDLGSPLVGSVQRNGGEGEESKITPSGGRSTLPGLMRATRI